MKKILILSLGICLSAILLITYFSYAQASENYAPNSSTGIHDYSGQTQNDPPWFDPAWHYRKPVVITNNGATLPYYQVLIRLDNTNFNFGRVKTDGSDLRFTHSDGTTELNYWIEAWDAANHVGYVWVRIPAIATGSTTIYLYYNNPNANAVSSGSITFDNFDDDWGQYAKDRINNGQNLQEKLLKGELYSPFTWITLSGSPEASAGILSLSAGDGIKSTTTYTYNALGMRTKFTSGNGFEWGGFINGNSGQRTIIGDQPSDPSNLYLVDYRTDFETVLLPRIAGEDWHNIFHVYEIRWKSGQSVADIDHGMSTATSTQPAQVPNTSLPVTFYSYLESNATMMVDWVYARQYRDPEPTFAVGVEQGLVDLRIENIGAPNPIRAGQDLTYQITISNDAVISATGVLVTDTLPANVQLVQVSSSQGTCTPGEVIYCDLNTIQANSTATITIIITPEIDGQITNTASVGSPGYELDLSDNVSEDVTLVDSVPPSVTWTSPIGNAGIYRTVGGIVPLEVLASDNDQIERVEFWWVNNDEVYLLIDSVTTPPYRTVFNTNDLDPGYEYFFEARAFDRAGNSNFPDSRKYIFIERLMATFFPLVNR